MLALINSNKNTTILVETFGPERLYNMCDLPEIIEVKTDGLYWV